MREGQWYRHSISKRAAVEAIVQIARVMQGTERPSFYGYENNAPEQFDRAVYSLADDVRRLKQEAEEYRKLKAALEPIIKWCR